MSKEYKIMPKLRFPEFLNDGEWVENELCEISEVIMGSSPKSEYYNENKIGLPLIQGNADIKKRMSLPRIYTSEITKECQVDDILLSVRAPVGTVAKSIHQACIGRGISAIRTKENNVQDFLYQWLIFYESFWGNISQGGTFEAVNSDDVRNLKLQIPARHEQQKIADCFSSLDDLISAHSQKLDALKDHKKGLMQQFFPVEGETVPKLRFKEFENDGEWDINEFSYYIKLYRGSSPRPIQNYLTQDDFGVNWIKIGDTKNAINSIINQVEEKITPKGAEKSRKVEVGELILANSMSFGKTYELAIEGYIYDGWFVLREYEEFFYKPFLLHLLNYEYMQKQYQRFSAGGIVQNISSEIVYKTMLFHTSYQEQQKIASCLSTLDALISSQTEKVEQLNQHKKGLMQGLFPKINY